LYQAVLRHLEETSQDFEKSFSFYHDSNLKEGLFMFCKVLLNLKVVVLVVDELKYYFLVGETKIKILLVNVFLMKLLFDFE
jgi:hypothetical protein